MILQQPTIKICTKCHIEKSIDQFNKQGDKKSKNYPIGTKSHCKACLSVYRKAFYSTPEGKKKGIEKSWKTKGINFTVEQYQELLKKQNGVCAICGAEKNKNNTSLCVDHDHKTGKIRGLLCHLCNTAIGKFNDDILMLEKAIEYIKDKNWHLK